MADKNNPNKSETQIPPAQASDWEIDSVNQHRVLCAIILERLQKQDVAWIRIADPEVKRVDDLQIATKSKVDAYLIRWSEWADTLTLNDLTSDQSESGSLIKQLADGWKRLKKEYRLPVYVHLLTNDQPSPKKIKGAKRNDCHLAKFLAQEWKNKQQDGEDWQFIWNELRTSSGLSNGDFDDFVEACKFDCSYARPELDEDADEYQPYHWVEHIYDTLFEHEDHSTLPILLNHAELLQLLGWRREQSRQLPVGQPGLNLNPGLYQTENNSTSRWKNSNSLDDTADFEIAESSSSASNVDQEGSHTEQFSNSDDAGDFLETGVVKVQPSLSSLRGAAAGWLQAASDSDSETADWLKAGAPPAGTTASGGTFFGKTSGGNFQNHGVLELEADEQSDSQNLSSLSTSFVGKKMAREKPSWKDLAEKQRPNPGLRKFNEPFEAKSDSAESQRITGRLRQMMSSIKTEAQEADADVEDEDFDHGDDNPNRQLRDLEDESDNPSQGRQSFESEVLDEIEREQSIQDGDSAQQKQIERQEEKEQQYRQDSDGANLQTDRDPDSANSTVTRSDSEEPTESTAEGNFEPHTDQNLETKPKTKRIKSLRNKLSEHERPSPGDENEQPDVENLPDADSLESFSPNKEEDDELKEGQDLRDTFSSISRLARKQQGTETGDLEASLDAFKWYTNNGNELFHEGRFEDSEKEYLNALQLIESLDVPTVEMEFGILQNLGDIYLFLDYPDKAVELYERTKEARFTSKIPASKYIAALIKLGATHEENNCFNDAEKQYRKAVEVAAENLEKDDPILVRLNQACLDLARNRSTLMSRFSSTEVERIRVLAKQEAEVSIMHRKKKTTEADLVQSDLWKSGSRPQTEEAPVPAPSQGKRWMMASAGIAILFVFAFASLVPHGGTAPGATGEGVGIFSTTDGRKVISLNQGGRAQSIIDGKSQDATYSFVGDSLQDMLPFIPGHMRKTFHFFHSQNSAIVDANGTYFYQENSPEHQLVKRMWKYADLAQGYRREKNFYPETDDAWTIAKEKLTFVNPITNATDQAIIFSTTGESTDSPIRRSIAAGENWKGQPAASPGRIICSVYNGRMFFIRGYDRKGRILTSSNPKSCFYIECSDGIDITKEDLQKPLTEDANAAAQNTDKKPCLIFASNPSTEAQFLTLLSAIPGALFCFSAVSLAVWRYRVNKKIAGPFSLVIFGIFATLLLAWFVVGLVQL